MPLPLPTIGRFTVAIASLFLLLLGSALGQGTSTTSTSYTWKGISSNGNWSDVSNWTGSASTSPEADETQTYGQYRFNYTTNMLQQNTSIATGSTYDVNSLLFNTSLTAVASNPPAGEVLYGATTGFSISAGTLNFVGAYTAGNQLTGSPKGGSTPPYPFGTYSSPVISIDGNPYTNSGILINSAINVNTTPGTAGTYISGVTGGTLTDQSGNTLTNGTNKGLTIDILANAGTTYPGLPYSTLILAGGISGNGMIFLTSTNPSSNQDPNAAVISANNTGFTGTWFVNFGELTLVGANAGGIRSTLVVGGGNNIAVVTIGTGAYAGSFGAHALGGYGIPNQPEIGTGAQFNAITGSGTVDVGGASTSSSVLVGFDNQNYTFAGSFEAQNSSDYVGKVGTGIYTLTGGVKTADYGGFGAVAGTTLFSGSSGGLNENYSPGPNQLRVYAGATVQLNNIEAANSSRLQYYSTNVNGAMTGYYGPPVVLGGGQFRLDGNANTDNTGTATNNTSVLVNQPAGQLTAVYGQSTVFVNAPANAGGYADPSTGKTGDSAYASVAFLGAAAPVNGATVYFLGTNLGQSSAANGSFGLPDQSNLGHNYGTNTTGIIFSTALVAMNTRATPVAATLPPLVGGTTAPDLAVGNTFTKTLGILPWATGRYGYSDNIASELTPLGQGPAGYAALAPNSFVTLSSIDGTNGPNSISVRPLAPTEYFPTINDSARYSNVRLSGNETVGSNRTINALVNTGYTVTLNANLTLGAGALLDASYSSGNSASTFNGSGTLVFGSGSAGTGTGYITASQALNINTPISAGSVSFNGPGATTVNAPISLGASPTFAVNSGTLTLSAGATVTPTSGGISYFVAQGATLSSTNPLTIGAGASLTGNGTIAGNGTLIVTGGGVISPSALPGPGTLSAAAVSFQPGGVLAVNLSSAVNDPSTVGSPTTNGKSLYTAGLLNANSIDLSTLSPTNPFTIRPTTYNLSNTPGPLYDLLPGTTFYWTVAHSATAISNFNTADFTVDTANFQLPAGETLQTFTVYQPDANDIALSYTPAPEPGSILLIATTVMIAGRVRRRRLSGRTVVAVLGTVALFSGEAFGQGTSTSSTSYTWKGIGKDGNWSDVSNWTGSASTSPEANHTQTYGQFRFTYTTNVIQQDTTIATGSAYDVNSLLFNTSITAVESKPPAGEVLYGATTGFSISGGTLNFVGAYTAGNQLTGSSSGGATPLAPFQTYSSPVISIYGNPNTNSGVLINSAINVNTTPGAPGTYISGVTGGSVADQSASTLTYGTARGLTIDIPVLAGGTNPGGSYYSLVLNGGISGNGMIFLTSTGSNPGPTTAVVSANNTGFTGTWYVNFGILSLVGANAAGIRSTLVTGDGELIAAVNIGTGAGPGGTLAAVSGYKTSIPETGSGAQFNAITGLGTVDVGGFNTSSSVLTGFDGNNYTYKGSFESQNSGDYVGKVGSGIYTLTSGSSTNYQGGFGAVGGTSLFTSANGTNGGLHSTSAGPYGDITIYSGATLQLNNIENAFPMRLPYYTNVVNAVPNGNYSNSIVLTGGQFRLDGNANTDTSGTAAGNTSLIVNQIAGQFTPTFGQSTVFVNAPANAGGYSDPYSGLSGDSAYTSVAFLGAAAPVHGATVYFLGTNLGQSNTANGSFGLPDQSNPYQNYGTNTTGIIFSTAPVAANPSSTPSAAILPTLVGGTTTPSLTIGDTNTTTLGILPWATGQYGYNDNIASELTPLGQGPSGYAALAPNSFVTLSSIDGTNGPNSISVRPLAPTEYFPTINGSTTYSNVMITAGETVSTPRTINALVNTGYTVTLNANLTLGAGALLDASYSSGNSASTFNGSGTLVFGSGSAGTGTGYITASQALNINTPISAGSVSFNGPGATTVNAPISLGASPTFAVNSGTLTLSAGATVTPTSGGISYFVAQGATLSSTNPLTIGAGASLTGNGTIAGNGTLIVTGGGVISPSALPGPGTLSAAAVSFQPGGVLAVNLSSAVNDPSTVGSPTTNGKSLYTAGLLNANSIDLSTLSPTNPFTIRPTTYNLSNTPGPLYDLLPGTTFYWTVAHSATAISNFNTADFTVDTANFQLPAGETLQPFTIYQPDVNDIALSYTPAPEPGSILLIATTVLAVGRRWRRRRSQARSPQALGAKCCSARLDSPKEAH